MTELISKLYYMTEDWVGQHDLADEETKKLEARQEALQTEIILRLGEDGQDMMEALADVNLKLETIHDEALFRAACGWGRGSRGPSAVPGRPPAGSFSHVGKGTKRTLRGWPAGRTWPQGRAASFRRASP